MIMPSGIFGEIKSSPFFHIQLLISSIWKLSRAPNVFMTSSHQSEAIKYIERNQLRFQEGMSYLSWKFHRGGFI
jgi:hypothetical protein